MEICSARRLRPARAARRTAGDLSPTPSSRFRAAASGSSAMTARSRSSASCRRSSRRSSRSNPMAGRRRPEHGDHAHTFWNRPVRRDRRRRRRRPRVRRLVPQPPRRAPATGSRTSRAGVSSSSTRTGPMSALPRAFEISRWTRAPARRHFVTTWSRDRRRRSHPDDGHVRGEGRREAGARLDPLRRGDGLQLPVAAEHAAALALDGAHLLDPAATVARSEEWVCDPRSRRGAYRLAEQALAAALLERPVLGCARTRRRAKTIRAIA